VTHISAAQQGTCCGRPAAASDLHLTSACRIATSHECIGAAGSKLAFFYFCWKRLRKIDMAMMTESRLCAVPSVPDIVQSSARVVASSELFLHQLSCSLRASLTGQSKEQRLLRHVIFEAASLNADGQGPLIKSEEYHTFDVSSTKISASPKQVLSFIDSFGWSKEWLMVVGGSKGAILDSCVHRLLTSGLLSIHFKEPFSQVFMHLLLCRKRILFALVLSILNERAASRHSRDGELCWLQRHSSWSSSTVTQWQSCLFFLALARYYVYFETPSGVLHRVRSCQCSHCKEDGRSCRAFFSRHNHRRQGLRCDPQVEV
jgi:hypothetical protein